MEVHYIKYFLSTFFIAVAEFSISPSSYNVSEQDGAVEVCVQLSGQLDRQISLQLIPSPDSASTSDFDASSIVYLFTPDTENPVCNEIGIIADDVVERRERFTVSLLASSEERAVRVLQSTAEVFINDFSIDCKSLFY